MGYSSGYQAVDAAMRSALLEAEETEADKTLRKGGVMIHGLSGTFDSLLYKSEQTGEEERISIAPKNFSTGMFSWFPLYFPLREPMM
jgi:protein arginine N-methyltransferase 5